MSPNTKTFADLLAALQDHGSRHPGQYMIPGWDGDTICRVITTALSAGDLFAALGLGGSDGDVDTVELVGIKDGKETALGRVPMPAEMKLREVMRAQFGGDPADKSSDAALGVAAGMEFWEWVTKKAYRRLFSQPAGRGHQADIPAGWVDAYAAFVGAFDTPVARRQIDNEFAQDARRRLREFNDAISATASKCGACHECLKDGTSNGIPIAMTRMILCPKCGNKRCPKAADHRNACTGSNEPGQPGSAYPKVEGLQK